MSPARPRYGSSRMATIDDAARMALDLDEVSEGVRHGNRAWSVDGKVFAWERPYSKADLRRFGDVVPPSQPVVAFTVEDLDVKEAMLAQETPGFFTISHFDGYAAYLVQLDAVDPVVLRDAIVDAWLCFAPADVATDYVRRHPPS